MSDHAEAYAAMMDALLGSVLSRAENRVKALRPDASAIAPEHTEAWEAGWRACKRAVLSAIPEPDADA